MKSHTHLRSTLLFALLAILLGMNAQPVVGQGAITYDYVFLIDTSGSMSGQCPATYTCKDVFPDLQRVMKDFVDHLPDGVNVLIIPFDNGVNLIKIGRYQNISSGQKQTIKDDIDNLQAIGPETRLWDSLDYTLDQMMQLATSDGRTHVQLLLLYTDGHDTGSSLSAQDVLRKCSLNKSTQPYLYALWTQLAGQAPSEFRDKCGVTEVENPEVNPIRILTIQPPVLDFGNLWADKSSSSRSLVLWYSTLDMQGKQIAVSAPTLSQPLPTGVAIDLEPHPIAITSGIATLQLSLINLDPAKAQAAIGNYQAQITLSNPDNKPNNIIVFLPQDLTLEFQVAAPTPTATPSTTASPTATQTPTVLTATPTATSTGTPFPTTTSTPTIPTYTPTITSTPLPTPTATPPPKGYQLQVRGDPSKQIDLGVVRIDLTGRITTKPITHDILLEWSDDSHKDNVGVNVALLPDQRNPSPVQVPQQWYLSPANSVGKKPSLYLTPNQDNGFQVGLFLTNPFSIPNWWQCYDYRANVVFTADKTTITGDVANPPNEPPRFEVKFKACQDWPWWFWLTIVILVVLVLFILTLRRFPYGTVLRVDRRQTDPEALYPRSSWQRVTGEISFGGKGEIFPWAPASVVYIRPRLWQFMLLRWLRLKLPADSSMMFQEPAIASKGGQKLLNNTWVEVADGEVVTVTVAGGGEHTIQLLQNQ